MVKASATLDPDPLHVSDETNDGQFLNPHLDSHKLLSAKSQQYLALSMFEH